MAIEEELVGLVEAAWELEEHQALLALGRARELVSVDSVDLAQEA